MVDHTSYGAGRCRGRRIPRPRRPARRGFGRFDGDPSPRIGVAHAGPRYCGSASRQPRGSAHSDGHQGHLSLPGIRKGSARDCPTTCGNPRQPTPLTQPSRVGSDAASRRGHPNRSLPSNTNASRCRRVSGVDGMPLPRLLSALLYRPGREAGPLSHCWPHLRSHEGGRSRVGVLGLRRAC